MADDEMTESMRAAMSLDGEIHRLRDFYDGWAGTYDDDVASHGYGLPEVMVAAVLAACELTGRTVPGEARVLDAGCGTGLVGVRLHAAGFHDLHGADLSVEMVERARERGVYRSLTAAVDLTEPAPADAAASFDVVAAGGVFTIGHAPPSALDTVATYCRPGGVIAVSTRAAYQADTGFTATQGALVESGRLSPLLHWPDRPYTMDSTGDYWAWQVPWQVSD